METEAVMARPLQPVPNVRLRAAICAVLVVLILFSGGSWLIKGLVAALAVFMCGSYRRAWLGTDRIEVQEALGFYPLRVKKYRLRSFVQIEVDVDSGLDAGTILLGILGTVFLAIFYAKVLPWWLRGPFGLFALPLAVLTMWILWRTGGGVLAWFGGRYRLALRSARDNQILVWQGDRENEFDANLALLTSATGLPVERGVAN